MTNKNIYKLNVEFYLYSIGKLVSADLHWREIRFLPILIQDIEVIIMAKMQSKKRGKSGSKKPLKPTTPTWIRYKPKEIELLVLKLAKEGKTTSEVGIILRDSYGVPSVKQLVGKTISQILKEKNILSELPEDINALIKRAAFIRKHLEKNKKDMSALRGLQFTESKIKRLTKYYKKTGRLPLEWKYSSEVKVYV